MNLFYIFTFYQIFIVFITNFPFFDLKTFFLLFCLFNFSDFTFFCNSRIQADWIVYLFRNCKDIKYCITEHYVYRRVIIRSEEQKKIIMVINVFMSHIHIQTGNEKLFFGLQFVQFNVWHHVHIALGPIEVG